MTTETVAISSTSVINHNNTASTTKSSESQYQDVIRLLEAIHEDNDICFQTFDDSKSGNKSLVGNWHGSADRSTMNRIAALNSKGAGVYYTVNQTDGVGRTASNIIGINALFIDLDGVEPQNLDKLPPASAIVQSKNGKHIYWFLNPGQDIKLFTPYQSMLAEMTGGDPVIKDLPRVLRLPGFYHMKDPSSPFMVELLELHGDRRYTLADFPTPSPDSVKKAKVSKGTTVNVDGSIESLETLVAEYRSLIAPVPLSDRQVANKRAQMTKALKASSRSEGTASNTMFKLGQTMGALLTTGTMTPSKLVELIFEAAKGQYGAEVKADGTPWNESEAKGHHITRGLSYYVQDAIDAHKNFQKLADLPTGIIKNSRYVSEMGIDYQKELLTIIKSAIGTGKTRALVDTIRDILAVTPDTQIQVVCHRVQLVRQWEHDLAEFGFIAYDNKEAMAGYTHASEVKRYITTYDSLDRFLYRGGKWKVRTKKPRILILDEVDQAFSYFLTATETTIAKVRTETFDVLKILSQLATSIIATSATVTNTEAEVLKYLTKSDSCQVFINEHKPYQKRFVKLPDANAAYSRICASIDEGKTVYVPLDSASDAEALHGRLNARYPQVNIALFTAANKSQYDQSDINSLVQKYQVVITSPTLGTGTDINSKYFHDVVGIFNNPQDLGAADCLQATGRVRYPLGNVYAYINDKLPTSDYTRAVEDKIISLGDNTLSTEWILLPRINCCEGDDDIRVEVPNHPDMEAATKFQAVYLEKQLEGKIYRGTKFWQMVADAGHIVTEEAKDALEKTITKADLVVAKEEIRQNEAQLIADAPLLDDEEASRLTAFSTTSLTKTDKAALDRFFIAKGMNKEDLTVEDILWYGKVGKNALRVHRLATMDKKLAWSLDYQDYGKLSNYDAKFIQQDKKTMDSLVAALVPVIEKGQFSKSDLADFEAAMISLGTVAIRRLGIKVDMTKPTVVANGILGLMGYEVEKKRVSSNLLVSQSSFKKSLKDTSNLEQTYLYTITPGEYKYLFNYSLAPIVTFELTDDPEYLNSLDDG
ncbi:DEAD/DEAH box helicase family protein [Nostoc sp.]|uniref:DEAD/DEAH box helicase family protein n=1 Tax=Nostoc sp. TaxID=1180 RepID=UPI002FFCABF5